MVESVENNTRAQIIYTKKWCVENKRKRKIKLERATKVNFFQSEHREMEIIYIILSNAYKKYIFLPKNFPHVRQCDNYKRLTNFPKASQSRNILESFPPR